MEPQRFSAKDKADRVWREKRGLHDYGTRDEVAPSPVSGLVLPSSAVVTPSPVSALVHEEHRYPNVVPLIFEFLSSGERLVPLQVDIAWWREVNICLAMLSTRARHPHIEVFLGSWKAQWELMNKESVALMRRSRPHVIGPNFRPAIRGGRYHEC